MEDYIQGIVCGYLTVQNGTSNDAKRRRMFVVLSDTHMDYYAVDPRPEFKEKIASTYAFDHSTQVHPYVEINPRAPMNSFCLITDKMTEVFIAESPAECAKWSQHLEERLQALSEVVKGTLLMREEISVNKQLQRKWLRSKYKWRPQCVELGRSTLRFWKSTERRTKLMQQFTLTSESYASEEPIEVLKPVFMTGSATSVGSLTPMELKKLPSDERLRQQVRGDVVFPLVVCTGPAHLYLAAPSDEIREQWISSIRMRVIALKYRHNRRNSTSDASSGSSSRFHGFMEVQFLPGAPWKKCYVELENEMLKVKANERLLGAKFETRLLPTCLLTPSLVKANAFSVKNRGQEISLAPGTLQDSQHWSKAIKQVTSSIPLARYERGFLDDVKSLLANSVVYTMEVPDGANAGLVVEKHNKRIFVLSHDTPNKESEAGRIPDGSVLMGITQIGMVHDSFETIWHKLRQKKGFHHPMTLTFRAPMCKIGLVDAKRRKKDDWELRRCVLGNGKLRVEALTFEEGIEAVLSSLTGTFKVLADLPLRLCRVELLTPEETGAPNVMKIVSETTTLFLRIHHDDDLVAWFVLLHLESAIALGGSQYPLSVSTMKKAKASLPGSGGVYEDQRRRFRECMIAGKRLAETEDIVRDLAPRIYQRARHDALRSRSEVESTDPEEVVVGLVPNNAGDLSDKDIQDFFMQFDVIGCGKISSMALSSTLDAITRHVSRPAREATTEVVNSALSKLVPPSRQYVPINLDQTMDVMKQITDVQVISAIRKFTLHEIQCM
ncbi:hypothetical protein Poli38472_005298 [Pythium oligandrum]|uniref:PH domain-containing protein n=1 Tax=Pythium oligandrum TaxID=41045 RepID=A0A8K1CGA8_PYTOL|nr:hypothetical protein Poli38472_005298 [Pythium oligandrum]|eukprot:TMW62680.1 hypothetical protein Poli38472_005298 [Pythium oligandrum]